MSNKVLLKIVPYNVSKCCRVEWFPSPCDIFLYTLVLHGKDIKPYVRIKMTYLDRFGPSSVSCRCDVQ